MQLRTSILRAALGTGLILLIPLALQLTIGTGVDGQGFNWKPGDFLVMGTLLFGTGMLLDVAIRTIKKPVLRILIPFAILFTFLLIWAELAVGIFGTPWAGF